MNLSPRSLTRCLLALLVLTLVLSSASKAQFRVAITFGPPALPVYEQPICPGEGYIWTPGYWAWDDDVDDYYWVPGTWVLAPEVGYLWTPAWWGWGGNAFIFHEGYWGPVVGFYGGINYGFGYFGDGYAGGRWERGRFFYNREVTRIDERRIRNVYNERVLNETRMNRVSYNGGQGGIKARPTPRQEEAAHERHLAPVSAQTQHVRAARGNQQLRASVNQGRPPIAATTKPGSFRGRSVVQAREAGAPYHPPANRGNTEARGNGAANRPAYNNANNNRPPSATHVRELPQPERRSAPNTGNAKLDQRYQRQQQKLYSQQDRERQKLQQRQEQDHQRMAQQRNAQARTQQLEQRHQQQTQKLQQKHEAQQQHMQQRQQPPARQNQSRPPKEKQ